MSGHQVQMASKITTLILCTVFMILHNRLIVDQAGQCEDSSGKRCAAAADIVSKHSGILTVELLDVAAGILCTFERRV